MGWEFSVKFIAKKNIEEVCFFHIWGRLLLFSKRSETKPSSDVEVEVFCSQKLGMYLSGIIMGEVTRRIETSDVFSAQRLGSE